MKIVLTGSIATGKSSVAKIFSDYGFEIIDADKIAHKILEIEKGSIEKIFGKDFILNNKVNRQKLGKLIFSDSQEKKKLDNLLHPLIKKEILKISEEFDKKEIPYLMDIPLYFETNSYNVDKIILVYTPYEIQIERLIERNSLSREEAYSRIKSQIDIEEKKKKSDFIIDNSGNKKELELECLRIKKEILVYTNKKKEK